MSRWLLSAGAAAAAKPCSSTVPGLRRYGPAAHGPLLALAAGINPF